jgi:hypothetical protein
MFYFIFILPNNKIKSCTKENFDMKLLFDQIRTYMIINCIFCSIFVCVKSLRPCWCLRRLAELNAHCFDLETSNMSEV